MQNGDGDKKIPAQRRAEVRGLVSLRTSASVSEIAGALDVSPSTVRRNLGVLETEGYLRRSPPRRAHELRFEERLRHDRGEKAAIGEYAVSFLEAGQSVIFDSSWTVLSAAEALGRGKLPITAVTNDVAIASVLAEAPDVEDVIPGGEVRRGSFTLPGFSMKGLHVDVALLLGIRARSLATPSANRAFRSSRRCGR